MAIVLFILFHVYDLVGHVEFGNFASFLGGSFGCFSCKIPCLQFVCFSFIVFLMNVHGLWGQDMFQKKNTG